MYFEKRGSKWYYGFTITDTNGQRRRIVRVGGATRTAAQKKGMEDYRRHTDIAGRWLPGGGGTFAEFWQIFIDEYVTVTLKDRTLKTYKSAGKAHILPALGKMELEYIKPRDIQQFINSLRDKLAVSSIEQILHVLRRAFRYAIEICEFIQKNPAKPVLLPRNDTAKKPTHVFDDYEIKELFERFPRDSKYRLPLALGYYAGLRIGECLALAWSDVDLRTGFIYIHRTMVSDGSYGKLQETPKTSASVRKIPIGDALIQELTAARHFQNKQRLQLGSQWQNHEKLCCTRNTGHHMVENDIRYFNMYCKDNFGAGTFHSLRHTHATMLLEAGEDLEVVSKRLGHSNINTTAKIYSHILEKRTKKNRQLLDDTFAAFADI